MKKITFTLLLLTSLSTTHAKEKKVQHDAHEHGVAEMNIVWEKEALNIELLSPAYNITGFEYQPSNHEQEELIEKIEKKLNLPNELFKFEGASCKAIKTEIESPFEDHDDHEKHDKHDDHDNHDDHKKHKEAKDDHDKHEDEEHKHAKHDEHEAKEKHDDHDEHKEHESHEKHDDHDDHAEDDKSSTHSEYSISYEFSCSNSEAELSISTANLFKHFPQMEKVKVQWLSSTQQSSSLLSKKNNVVTLK